MTNTILSPPPRLIYLRDLLRELVLRDIKLRYKRSLLGLAWSLLNPLFQLVVFVFIFRVVLPLNIPAYASFVFIGILVWTWFQATLYEATVVIIRNPDLIRRPGFPLDLLPVVTITSNLIHFLLALPILFVFLWFSGGAFHASLLFLPVLISLQFIFTLGLSYLTAAIHVYFRDMQYLLGVILMLAFYLTPIFYDAAYIPAGLRAVYDLNPMVHFVGGYRAVLLAGSWPPLRPFYFIGGFSVLLLYVSRRLFVRASDHFVDEL